MSAETQAAVDAAIAAHVADELPGHFVPASVTFFAAQALEGELTTYNWIIPIGQPFHVSMGLTTAGEALLMDYWDAD